MYTLEGSAGLNFTSMHVALCGLALNTPVCPVPPVLPTAQSPNLPNLSPAAIQICDHDGDISSE